MAASDGGHVWPPRATDLRIQELTGGSAKPDEVFTALRAEGYTGSIDDMWKQHLVVAGITDTSEPFTDSLATTIVGPDIGAFATGPAVGDSILDISPSWGPMGVHVDSTETYMVYGENDGDYMILGTMSTPGDISTLTQTNVSADLGPPPEGVAISDAGTTVFYCGTNYVYSRPLSSAWDVSTIGAQDASSVQFTGLANPITDIFITHDGLQLIACDKTGKVQMVTLGTAWTLSSAGTISTSTAMVSQISTFESKALAMDPSATKIYMSNAVSTGKIWMGVMTGAADLSTLSYDSQITLTGLAANNPIGMGMSADAQSIWLYGDVQNRCVVLRPSA